MAIQTNIKSGLWTTEGGSTLKLTVQDTGLVTGLYATSHGRAGKGEEFPVTGIVNNDLIGLVCSWGQYHSMTTWNGRYYDEDGQDTIHYMWHLAREYENLEEKIKNDITFTFHTMSGVFYYQGEQ